MTKRFFSDKSLPLLIYLFFLLITSFFVIRYQKHELHLIINSFVGNYWIDKLFLYLTWFGDGILGVVILLLVFMYNVRLGAYLTLVFIAAAITTSILKYSLFSDAPRPHFVFQWTDPHEINKVDGAELMILRSFPSGHATQSFALYFTLALASISRRTQVAFSLLAVFTAFSRVYLSQHWVQDIIAGSVVGVFYALLFYFIFYQKNFLKNWNKPLFSKIDRH